MAAQLLFRLALGLPHDVLWRVEHLTIDKPFWWVKAVIILGFLGLVSTLIASASSPVVDLQTSLHVEVTSSGWLREVEITNGATKVVPAISFTLKNLSDRKLGALQVNAVFSGVDEKRRHGWGTAFRRAVGSGGLAPDATTRPLFLKAQGGYTGLESDVLRDPMRSRSLPVGESNVTLFAKYEFTPWTRLVTYVITRQLIEP